MSQEDAKPVEYAMELKLAAVRRVLAGESVSAVAQELGIRRKRLYVWKDRYAELGEAGLVHRRGGRPRKEGSAIAIAPATLPIHVSRDCDTCSAVSGRVCSSSI